MHLIADDLVPEPLAPDAQSLHALAEKYRTLAALRHAHLRGAPSPPAREFRRLAHEFPGALRELDTVALPALEASAAALTAAARTSPTGVRAWMAWQCSFHRWMRVALAAKRHLARDRSPADVHLVSLATQLGHEHGVEVSLPFLRGCAAPPQGKLTWMVLAHVAERFVVPASRVRAAVTPTHRSHPDD